MYRAQQMHAFTTIMAMLMSHVVTNAQSESTSAILRDLVPLSTATNRYVAQYGQTPDEAGEFTSWSNAATNIQDAVLAANPGDTILVAPGTYRAPVDATSVVQIEGGLIPTGSTLTLQADRPPEQPPGEVIIDGAEQTRGIVVDLDDADAPRTLVIDGFQVINGYTSGAGAGISFFASGAQNLTADIRNCEILYNTAVGHGAGINSYRTSSTHPMWLTLDDSRIAHNESIGNPSSGGAGSGPGIRFGAPGGGLTVLRSTIEHNVAIQGYYQRGGGIWNRFGFLEVENSVIRNNIALSDGNSNVGGGAIYREGNGTVTVRNSLLAGNTGYRGGAIHFQEATTFNLDIRNCTIVDNNSGWSVITFRNSGGSGATFRMINTIMYYNERILERPPTSGTEIIFRHLCVDDLNHYDSDVLGPDSFFTAPAFVDRTAGNYRLTRDSPCVNTGLNEDWMLNARDLDGRARIDGATGKVDIGAYEYVYPGTTILIR